MEVGDLGDEPDDERSAELEALAAIFPELIILPYDRKDDVYQASLQLDIEPSNPVQITTPKSNDVATTLVDGNGVQDNEIHDLKHLPPLKIDIALPSTYPHLKSPSIQLESEDAWLPAEKMRHLSSEANNLWEATGREQVLFSYIDYIREQADDAFGIRGVFAVPPALKLILLDFDLNAKKAKFERGTYDCGVCLGKLFNLLKLGLTLMNFRTKEGPGVSSFTGMLSCVLPRVPARFLHELHHRG